MKKKKFIKIAQYFLPELIEQLRKNEITKQLVNIFHEINVIKSDNEVKELNNIYESIIVQLNESDYIYFHLLLQSVKDLILFTNALIDSPIKYANELNMKLKKSHEGVDDNTFPQLSFQCACASIIGLLTVTLTSEEKENQLILQQKRLNIALQNEWHDKNAVNYWYALHFYIKGNESNVNFFINNLLIKSNQSDRDLIIDDKMFPWIKNKIPLKFKEKLKLEYENWVNSEMRTK